MTYDLWDIGARFFFDRFLSEEEALAYVARLLEEYGDTYAEDLELVVGEGGQRNLSGRSLVERVRALEQPPVKTGAKIAR